MIRILKNTEVLIVRIKKTFYINGQFEIEKYFDKQENIMLSPNLKGVFYVSDKKSEDGTYILINEKTKEVILESGIGNIFPIYYYLEDDLLVLARSINSIKEIIKKFKREMPKIDIIGVVSSLIFDYPINDHTYYEKIKKSEMGTEIIFNRLSENSLFKN